MAVVEHPSPSDGERAADRRRSIPGHRPGRRRTMLPRAPRTAVEQVPADERHLPIEQSRRRTVEVAHDTLVLLATMIEAWEVTGGRHDAGVLPRTDRQRIRRQRRSIPDGHDRARRHARFRPGAIRDILVDPDARVEVSAPRRARARSRRHRQGPRRRPDRRHLLSGGAQGALVSIGGDLAMAGDSPRRRRMAGSSASKHPTRSTATCAPSRERRRRRHVEHPLAPMGP